MVFCDVCLVGIDETKNWSVWADRAKENAVLVEAVPGQGEEVSKHLRFTFRTRTCVTQVIVLEMVDQMFPRLTKHPALTTESHFVFQGQVKSGVAVLIGVGALMNGASVTLFGNGTLFGPLWKINENRLGFM